MTIRTDRGDLISLPPQCRHILAVLAASVDWQNGALVDKTVAQSEIIEDVWQRDTGKEGHRVVEQIRQIRSALGRETIKGIKPGYQLQPHELGLDLVRFKQLCESAKSAADVNDAVAFLVEALALWTGPFAFGGVDDSAIVDGVRHALQKAHQDAVDLLAKAEIQLQRPDVSVGHLHRRFANHPEDDSVVRLLAELLALDRREFEASRVIARHRAATKEIGLLLTPELADLEQRILRREFQLPTTDEVRLLEEPASSFHRSDRLITRPVDDDVSATLATSPVVIVGQPGVGKTVLATGIGQRAEQAGRPVLWVTASAEPGRPLEVAADAIEGLRRLLPTTFAERLRDPAAAAAVGRVTGAAATAGAGPTLSRQQMVESISDIVGTVLDADGLLIVEDGHWMDPTSEEIVGRLVAARRPGVLVTSRERMGVRPGPSWAAAATFELPPFTSSEVQAIVEQVLSGRATDRLVRRLHRASGGNGVFLQLELDQILGGSPADAVSPDLLFAVNRRTRRFSVEARSVLQSAALLGQIFPLDALAVLHPDFEALLYEPRRDALVRLDIAANRGEFLHGSVVDALVELLDVDARLARRDALGEALRSVAAPPIVVAHQAVLTKHLDPLRAVESCLGTAYQQAAVFEWESTISWARRGLEVLSSWPAGATVLEAELRLLVGTGLRRSSLAGSGEELVRAADLAAAADAHELHVRCVTELCLHGSTSKLGSVDETALRHFERALDAPVALNQRAELLSAAATLMAVSDDAPMGRALYHEALTIAESLGDRGLLRTVWVNAHLGLYHPADLGWRRSVARELLTLDDLEAQWEGQYLRFGIALIDADRARVDDALVQLRRLTELVKQRDHQRSLLQVETAHAFVAGELDRAETLATETLDANLASYPVSWATGIYAALLVPILEAQGRVGDIASEVQALSRSAPDFVTWRVLSAGLAYANDDRSAMADEVDHLAAAGFPFAEDLTWTAVVATMCRPVRALGDVRSAAVLYERLLPHSGSMTWNGLSTHGPVDAGLACLADVLDDRAAVAHHVEIADELVRRLGAPHLRWPELDALRPAAGEAARSADGARRSGTDEDTLPRDG
ncbi:MAG: BTAD domain-containing putative transcriptional regulator [Ilumatobacteraceae bacterium]